MDEPLSVIVVDDQAPFRMAARAVDAPFGGLRARRAKRRTVWRRWQLANELHPAVVLMDINMPEMGGIERRGASSPTSRDLRHPLFDLRHQ